MPAGVAGDRLHPVELLFLWPDRTSVCELLLVRRIHSIADPLYLPVVMADLVF